MDFFYVWLRSSFPYEDCCFQRCWSQCFFLLVVPPSIEHQPRIYVIARQDARFPCDYRGFPTPSVYWTVTHLSIPNNVTEGGRKLYFDDIVDGIRVQRELKVTRDGSLVIPQVLYSDSMVQYQCTAINRLGVAKVDVYLTVVKGGCSLTVLQYLN